MHAGRLVTLFSARNYFGREENDESQAEGVVQNIEPGQEYAEAASP